MAEAKKSIASFQLECKFQMETVPNNGEKFSEVDIRFECTNNKFPIGTIYVHRCTRLKIFDTIRVEFLSNDYRRNHDGLVGEWIKELGGYEYDEKIKRVRNDFNLQKLLWSIALKKFNFVESNKETLTSTVAAVDYISMLFELEELEMKQKEIKEKMSKIWTLVDS